MLHNYWKLKIRENIDTLYNIESRIIFIFKKIKKTHQ